jgi:hypothetical protein
VAGFYKALMLYNSICSSFRDRIDGSFPVNEPFYRANTDSMVHGDYNRLTSIAVNDALQPNGFPNTHGKPPLHSTTLTKKAVFTRSRPFSFK